jgi:hypothetical protein
MNMYITATPKDKKTRIKDDGADSPRPRVRRLAQAQFHGLGLEACVYCRNSRRRPATIKTSGADFG